MIALLPCVASSRLGHSARNAISEAPMHIRTIVLPMLFSLFASAANADVCARNYIDASRGNRSIAVLFRYPLATGGQPLTGCALPSVVIGHGFTISNTAYAGLANGIAAQGYLVALPATESSLSPSHPQFGLDLAFVGRAMQTDAQFQNRIGSTRAVIGHSMGGGAAFLAAASDSAINRLIALAPAETTPSAITAAGGLTLPTLIITGSRDCVAPTASNAQLMFNNLGTPPAEKQLVELIGASHCQFSDGSFTCSIGENSCNGGATISAASQTAQTLALVLPWLAPLQESGRFADGFEVSE